MAADAAQGATGRPTQPVAASAGHLARMQPRWLRQAGSGSAGGRPPVHTALLVVLVVAMALLGVGSALAANSLAAAFAAHTPGGASTGPQVITIVRPDPSHTAPTAPAPTIPPTGCFCTGSQVTLPAPDVGAPNVGGQVILVSISQQWLWAYQDRRLVIASPITTGMPQLPTPRGTYHIMGKESNIMFYSPWPYGSPYYYTPEHIDYAMLFKSGGFYLHNAPWRHSFGPGTNVPHTDPDGTYETGSHGCVNMPTPAAAALYAWVYDSATVIIVG